MVWSGLSVPITPQMKIVMDYLRDYEEMSDEDLQELLNIKKTRAYLLARQMSEARHRSYDEFSRSFCYLVGSASSSGRNEPKAGGCPLHRRRRRYEKYLQGYGRQP